MSEEVPFYLMPVAAVFGMYTLVGGIRILTVMYSNLTTKKDSTSMPPSITLTSKTFYFLVVTVAASAVCYAKVVAAVENAMDSREHALFDPYEILAVSESSNSTVIKKAYREMSKTHHPDKGGSPEVFQKLHLAYKALTDETSKSNFDKYGHPDGPAQSKSLSFALPEWLLHPEGTTAVVLILLYFGMFASLIYIVINWSAKTDQSKKALEQQNSVAGSDAAYLASKLHPGSTHMDVLFLVATTPENINLSSAVIAKGEKLKAEKLAKLKQKQADPKKKGATGFDFDDGGWDDDEGDEAAAKAKKIDDEKAKAKAEFAKATQDKADALIEGVDDGVLGQCWVEKMLESKGQWPPPNMGVLKGTRFANDKGESVPAMEHLAVRKNLCMTMGRLNAQTLNTHSELLEAGAKGLVDPSYFQSTMEYRQRSGLLLEAALRVSMSAKSYRLAKTIVETVSMFKLGTASPQDKETLQWFESAMQRQYGGEAGVPKLEIKNYSVFTADEDEIATGDSCTVELEMERLHAENFTKAKIAQCQKQGIPPQIALQSYREGWWVLLRAKRISEDGAEEAKVEAIEDGNPLSKMLEGGNLKRFEAETGENRLLSAWPMIVQNVAQKSGKVKVQFKAPATPGKYRFYVAVKSQEFLGADQEFTVEADIVDHADVTRNEEDDDETEDDETKKEK